MIAGLLVNLVGQVIGIFGAKGKAAQENLATRVNAMERSWTDEFITLVWFSPVLVSWFNPERANAWIVTVTGNTEYFGMLAGITAAVFGLGKINGRK